MGRIPFFPVLSCPFLFFNVLSLSFSFSHISFHFGWEREVPFGFFPSSASPHDKLISSFRSSIYFIPRPSFLILCRSILPSRGKSVERSSRSRSYITTLFPLPPLLYILFLSFSFRFDLIDPSTLNGRFTDFPSLLFSFLRSHDHASTTS